MNKLVRMAAFGVIALTVGCETGYATSISNSLPQATQDKVYIVNGIFDYDQVCAIVDSLESRGLSGVFLVSFDDVNQYSNTVKMLQARGHAVVLPFGSGKEQQASKHAKINFNKENSNPVLPTRELVSVESVKLDADYDKDATSSSTELHPEGGVLPDKSTKREFLGVDKDGRHISTAKSMTKKESEDVPDWSIESIVKLSEYGLLMPEDVFYIQSVPTRDFMAKMIVRAYRNLEGETGSYVDDANVELKSLMIEYDTELRNLGYGAGFYAKSAKLKMNKNLKLNGEIRLSYRDNSGDDPFNNHDMRLRTRLYLGKPLMEDWSAHAMVESEKSWVKDQYNGSVELERLYIHGKHKDVDITVGRFGRELADGTYYDGRFTGASLSTKINDIEVQFDAGKLRDNRKIIAMEGKYSQPKQDVSIGVYKTGDNTVGTTATTYYFGNWGLGARLLYAQKTGSDGKHGGYVLSARYGRHKVWVPGSYEFYINYYNQPFGTYVAHTMVGMADYLHGFKGYGLGVNYTIMENLVYDIEYFDLKSMDSSVRARTLWNYLSYYF